MNSGVRVGNTAGNEMGDLGLSNLKVCCTKTQGNPADPGAKQVVRK